MQRVRRKCAPKFRRCSLARTDESSHQTDFGGNGHLQQGACATIEPHASSCTILSLSLPAAGVAHFITLMLLPYYCASLRRQRPVISQLLHCSVVLAAAV